ncbi:unnamed protein product [Protopolystoma xenopodis]|uniref:Uncharacterized protein n=1 Tax=Protopolystoma xenopodis TaxID=117903 RepID=A0A448XRI9_9PLAT|nr:unnamed protein product [Protopolystoma xenopodis]
MASSYIRQVRMRNLLRLQIKLPRTGSLAPVKSLSMSLSPNSYCCPKRSSAPERCHECLRMSVSGG